MHLTPEISEAIAAIAAANPNYLHAPGSISSLGGSGIHVRNQDGSTETFSWNPPPPQS